MKGDFFAAEVENALEGGFYPQPADDFAQRSQRQDVGHAIGHFDAPGFRSEMVFVMPDFIGSGPLFIDEVRTFAHVGDFSQPADTEARQKADSVGDHLPGVHRAGICQRFKMQFRWRERIEIIGRREKIPDFLGRGRNKLSEQQLVNHGDNG